MRSEMREGKFRALYLCLILCVGALWTTCSWGASVVVWPAGHWSGVNSGGTTVYNPNPDVFLGNGITFTYTHETWSAAPVWNWVNSNNPGSWDASAADTLTVNGGNATGWVNMLAGSNTITVNGGILNFTGGGPNQTVMGDSTNTINVNAGSANFGNTALGNLTATNAINLSGGNATFGTVGAGTNATTTITASGAGTYSLGATTLGGGNDLLNHSANITYASINTNGGNDELRVTGGTTTVTGAANMGDGNDQVNISSSGAVSVGSSLDMGNGTDSISVSGTGSSLTVANDLNMGITTTGTSTLSVTGSSTLSVGGDITANAGNASINIASSQNFTMASGGIHMNGGGTKTVTIANTGGATASLATGISSGNGTTTVNLDSATTIVAGGVTATGGVLNLNINDDAVNIAGGVHNVNGALNLDVNASGSTITGGISAYSVSLDYSGGGTHSVVGGILGDAGNDSIRVGNGTTLNVTGGDILLGSGTNSITLDDNNARLTASGDVAMGGGTDTINIGAGGQFTINGSGGLDMGDGLNSINLSSGGSGTLLNITAGGLNMGDDGNNVTVGSNATLNVANGVTLGSGVSTFNLGGDTTIASGGIVSSGGTINLNVTGGTTAVTGGVSGAIVDVDATGGTLNITGGVVATALLDLNYANGSTNTITGDVTGSTTGNDSIRVGNNTTLDIVAGGGQAGNVDLGDGNNSIATTGTNAHLNVDGYVATGGGNDSVSVGSNSQISINGDLAMGHGQNTVTANAGGALLDVGGSMIMGDDNDRITVGSNSDISVAGTDGIKMGGGENTVTVYGNATLDVANGGVEMGNGKDTINLSGNNSAFNVGGNLDMGEGENTIALSGTNTILDVAGNLTMGSDNTDNITVGNGTEINVAGGLLDMKDGDNNLTVHGTITSAEIEMGSTGTDTVVLTGSIDGNLNTKSGEDFVTASGAGNQITGNLVMGNGRKTVDMDETDIGGHVDIGTGQNSIALNDVDIADYLSVGDGANTIDIQGGSVGTTTTVGKGNNSITIGNGAEFHDEVAIGVGGTGRNIVTVTSGVFDNSITIQGENNVVNLAGAQVADSLVIKTGSGGVYNILTGTVIDDGILTDALAGENNTITVAGGEVYQGTSAQAILVGTGNNNDLLMTGGIIDGDIVFNSTRSEITFSGGIYRNGDMTVNGANNTSTFTNGAELEGGRNHTYTASGQILNFENAKYGLASSPVNFFLAGGSDTVNIDGGTLNGQITDMYLNITDSGGDNRVNIKSGNYRGVLTLQDGNNIITHSGGTVTKNDDPAVADSGHIVIDGSGARNVYYLTGSGVVDATGKITVTADGNDTQFFFTQDAGTMAGTLTSDGVDIQNVMSWTGTANYSGTSTVKGTNNYAIVDLANMNRVWSGSVDMSGSVSNDEGYNEIVIKSGNLTNAAGAFHGSDDLDSLTVFNISGGTIAQLYGGAGSSEFNLFVDPSTPNTVANAKNIQGNQTGSSKVFLYDTAVAGTPHNYTNLDVGDYMMETLLNMNQVTFTNGATLSIGSIDIVGNSLKSQTEAQITADSVFVDKGSKLYIHEAKSNTDIADSYRTILSDNANIINHLNIKGVVNIDRTTIQGIELDTDNLANRSKAAEVVVERGGLLHGWTDKLYLASGAKSNILGNLTISGGGTIQPYDVSMWQGIDYGDRLRAVVFKVDKAENGDGGTVNWNSGSILSTRMFASGLDVDQTPEMIFDNQTKTNVARTLSDSDSVKAVDSQFNFNWSDPNLNNANKVQYDPVFGHSYELSEKQAFERYSGADPDSDLGSYYYKVVLNDQQIAALQNSDDANNIFNEDIVKSDMLGEWEFLKSSDNQNVYVRFRLLASHPTEGGLAKDLTEPNAINASKVLDNVRYPFETDFNKDLGYYEKDDPAHWYNQLTGYDGYDGDIVNFYEEAYKLDPDLYSNYRKTWIEDFTELLSGIQTSIYNGDDMNQAIRQLHPEAYASATNINFDIMNQFHRVRENAYIANLYAVENEMYEQEMRKIEGNDGAYANFENGFCGLEPFVCNPMRIWASGFGSTGAQKNRNTEYGWDSDTWGGAVGGIKEFGDLYVGGTLGYARDTSTWDDLNAKAKTDAFIAEGLVGLRLCMGFVEVFGNYSYNDRRMTRHIDLNTYKGNALGEYHDTVYGGGVRLGYQQIAGQWLIIPTVGLTYMRSQNSAFTEDGRQDMFTLLRVGKGDIKRNQYRMPLTVRVNRSFALRNFVFTPEFRFNFTPVFGNKAGTAKAEFVGNPIPNQTFIASGLDAGRYVMELGVSMELARAGRFFLRGNYDFQSMRKNYSHNFSVSAGLNF